VPKNDQHFAIAIGIDTYPQLRRLTASVKDAADFCEWLTSDDGGNLPDQNVKLIPSSPALPADPFDARPIQTEIDRALRDFGVERGSRIGKRLYFYFAGHGFGPSFDNVGMLMANAAMNRLKYNIGLRPYRDYFHESRRFDEVVFVLDCCRDRDFSRDTMAPGFDKDPAPDGKRVVDFVLMASAYGEKAFAPVDKPTNERRGLLTKAVLEGLRGAPRAFDAEGRITSSSLREYVLERVKALAKDDSVMQEAEITLPSAEIVLRQTDPAKLKRVRVHFVAPLEINGEIILRDGTRRDEIERRDANLARADNPWSVDLLASSRYELEHAQSDLSVIIDPGKAQKEPYVIQLPRP
jgi:uncharacterized caspase-like protein